MINLKRDLIESIVLGLIIGIIGILAIVQFQQTKTIDIQNIETITSLKSDIKSLEEEIVYAEKYNNFMFTVMNSTDNIILGTQNGMIKQIENLPNKIKYDKIKLEKKLQACNVMIHNETLQEIGSGVTLKYKSKFYILTAGHMLNERTDKLTFSQNEENFGELEVIKWDFDLTDNTLKGNDLLLLQPKNKELIPKVYVELADYEPDTALEVCIVGNPMEIENCVSTGRVLTYQDNFMYISDNIYFGSSGGGVYNPEGKLIGIVSHMTQLQPDKSVYPFIIHGIVRLNVIKEFIGDVE